MPLSLAGTSGGTIAMSYSILWTYFAWTHPPQLRRHQAQPQRHRQQALPPRPHHQARMGSRLLKRGYELLFAFIFLSRIFEKSLVRYVSEPGVGHRVFLGWPLHPSKRRSADSCEALATGSRSWRESSPMELVPSIMLQ